MVSEKVGSKVGEQEIFRFASRKEGSQENISNTFKARHTLIAYRVRIDIVQFVLMKETTRMRSSNLKARAR